MLIEIELLVVAGLVIGLLVLSVLDFALVGVNKIALRRITDATHRRKNSLNAALVDSRPEVLMAIHISIQTVLIAIAVLLTDVFLRTRIRDGLALPAAAATTVVLVLVFRQLLPRAIASSGPEAALGRLVSVLGVPYFILRPIVRLILAILHRFDSWERVSPAADDDASDEEIQAFIDAGQEEGILEQDEGEMIHSIVQFGDTLALEVMTPRPQIIAADVSAGFQKVIDLIVENRHSRIPIYRDELDNVEGIIHERDLLASRHVRDDPGSLRPLLRPAHFVPETKPVDDLLEEMKAEGHQMSLVVDEYGGISGLITIEDLIEEIVGEIDEDPASLDAGFVEEGAGTYLVSGRTELDMVNDRLGQVLFPDTECTTVGGAVVELFGRLPSSGERVHEENLRIEVVAADRRRVRSVRIRVAAEGAGA